MRPIVVLYLFGTFSAALTAVILSFLFPTTLVLATGAEGATPPQGIAEVLNTLLFKLVDNPVSALMNANYIGILAWGVGLGLALHHSSSTTKAVFEDLSHGISQIVRFIIRLAPFGIFGLVASTFATTGFDALAGYAQLLAVLLGAMAFIALVVNPMIVYYKIRRNPFPLVLQCLRESGVTAFFTRSSAANIPVNMALCEKLKLDEDTYSVSIPLGATINMDGTSIMQGVAVIFIAQVYGMELTPAQLLTVIATAMIASIGTAGIPSVGLIMLAMVLTSVGLPTEGIALIMGIDRILDMFRTAVNITGDAVCTTIVSSQNKELDRSIFNRD